MALFALASFAAGLAPSTGALLAARAAQGLGAALAIPAALALISASYRVTMERGTIAFSDRSAGVPNTFLRLAAFTTDVTERVCGIER